MIKTSHLVFYLVTFFGNLAAKALCARKVMDESVKYFANKHNWVVFINKYILLPIIHINKFNINLICKTNILEYKQ